MINQNAGYKVDSQNIDWKVNEPMTSSYSPSKISQQESSKVDDDEAVRKVDSDEIGLKKSEHEVNPINGHHESLIRNIQGASGKYSYTFSTILVIYLP